METITKTVQCIFYIEHQRNESPIVEVKFRDGRSEVLPSCSPFVIME